MLAENNPDINKNVNLFNMISKDEKARILYEAREAQIKDELTRMKAATQEGREESYITIAKEMLAAGEPIGKIVKYTKLTEEKIAQLRKELSH